MLLTMDLLRDAGHCIHGRLARLFTECLKQSKIPKTWNEAIVEEAIQKLLKIRDRLAYSAVCTRFLRSKDKDLNLEITNEVHGAKLVTIILYPANPSRIIVLL